MPGEQAVALPDAAPAARGDLDAAQHQLLGDPHGAMAGVGQRVVEDRLLDRGADPVGGARAPAIRSSSPSAPKVWKFRRIS